MTIYLLYKEIFILASSFIYNEWIYILLFILNENISSKTCVYNEN